MQKRIIVEGNIASGKSTFLDYAKKKYGEKIEIIKEPLDKWQNVNGENLLEKFYTDPQRWAFAFQVYAQFTLMSRHKDSNITFMERSILSGRYCFVENLFKNKLLTTLEYNILDSLFEDCIRDTDFLDHTIYLKTEPEAAMKHLQLRNRKEERGVDISLLKQLDELHDKWLLEGKYHVPGTLHVINVSYDWEKDSQEYDNVLKKII